MAAAPRISVIVPCCNMEGCVTRCVESILAQTLGDFELLLVDDGSTDGTRVVLARFEDDERVSVFEKPNGGLSDARNFGVARARAPYITFVDADDYVSPRYLEALASGLVEGKKTMVASHFIVVPEEAPSSRGERSRASEGAGAADETGREPDGGWQDPRPARTLDRTLFGREVLYERITESGWGKLAPREVYERFPFPKGRVYEDLATVLDHVGDCEAFAEVVEPVYAYVMRRGSITNRSEGAVERGRDYLDALSRFEACAIDLFPLMENGLAFRRCLTAARLHALVARSRGRAARAIDRHAVALLRENLPAVESDPEVPRSAKLRFKAMAKAPGAYLGALGAYEKIVKKL